MLPAQPTVITVYLSKGGIAKSTLSALLGLFLAGLGYRVVIVDLDQQGSQSAVFDLLDEEGRSREVLHQVLKRRERRQRVDPPLKHLVEHFAAAPFFVEQIEDRRL